ncbi:MAG: lipid-A-disaccharide synthase N-terminal domain-containing protein [Planctomycetota bacterium]
MDVYLWIGGIGQALFFARFLVQLVASEKAGRIAVPTLFWWFSLVGSGLFLIYTLHIPNAIFAAGAVTNLLVYARNILLAHGFRRLGPTELTVLLVAIAAASIALFVKKLEFHDPLPWLLVGGVGQAIWMTRFPLQWLQSEQSGRPVLPPSFFVISIVGSLFILAYALYLRDVILIASVILVPFMSARNLVLERRHRAREAGAQAALAASFE